MDFPLGGFQMHQQLQSILQKLTEKDQEITTEPLNPVSSQ